MDVDILWHLEPHELRSEMDRALNDFDRNDMVAHDRLIVIDISQKQVQRRDPLAEAAFDMFPFGTWNNAGDQVKGKNSFSSFLIIIDCERHPLRKKSIVCK